MNAVKNEKIKSILFVVIFCMLVIGMGTLSLSKLVHFYVYNEVDYNEWYADLGNEFETDIASNIYGKMNFVGFNGAVRNLLGQHEMNGVIKLNNGYLQQLLTKSSDETLHEYADNIIGLSDVLEDNGIKMVYASPMYTVGKYDEQLPIGVYDYGNDNLDSFLNYLDEGGVDTIDYRSTMQQDGIEHYSMVYRTDHHWNTRAGFYAYTKLEDYINERLDCKVDDRVGDISQYSTTIYEKWHLGSRGQRTGMFYGGIDDFELILPRFETSITAGGETGSFQDIIIDMSALQQRDLNQRLTYDSVLENARGLYNYTNNLAENDVRILIISDSFSEALNPYLILAYKHVSYYYNSDSCYLSADSIINDYQPDVVVLLYYPALLCEGSTAFQFEY